MRHFLTFNTLLKTSSDLEIIVNEKVDKGGRKKYMKPIQPPSEHLHTSYKPFAHDSSQFRGDLRRATFETFDHVLHLNPDKILAALAIALCTSVKSSINLVFSDRYHS